MTCVARCPFLFGIALTPLVHVSRSFFLLLFGPYAPILPQHFSERHYFGGDSGCSKAARFAFAPSDDFGGARAADQAWPLRRSSLLRPSLCSRPAVASYAEPE